MLSRSDTHGRYGKRHVEARSPRDSIIGHPNLTSRVVDYLTHDGKAHSGGVRVHLGTRLPCEQRIKQVLKVLGIDTPSAVGKADHQTVTPNFTMHGNAK